MKHMGVVLVNVAVAAQSVLDWYAEVLGPRYPGFRYAVASPVFDLLGDATARPANAFAITVVEVIGDYVNGL
jgi:hypothetical protein